MPGLLLFALGLVGYALRFARRDVGGATFDAHTLLFASLAMLGGPASDLFALFAKTFAINEDLLPRSPHERFFESLTLERGLAAGVVAARAGMARSLAAAKQWRQVGLRSARLRAHHAAGHPRGDADRARAFKPILEFLRQHFEDGRR